MHLGQVRLSNSVNRESPCITVCLRKSVRWSWMPYILMSFLIYLIHPAEQQTKPGRSLLHVHNPRHLWHLGHAGCRHLCKGSRFIFDEFVKIPLLWLRFCFFDIKTSGGRHFAWVQLQQAPWNYLRWWLLAWGSGLWILFVLQQWLFSLKALAVVCLIAWSLVSTYVLLRSIDFFLPFRAGFFFIIPVFKPMENVCLSSYIGNQMGHSQIILVFTFILSWEILFLSF